MKKLFFGLMMFGSLLSTAVLTSSCKKTYTCPTSTPYVCGSTGYCCPSGYRWYGGGSNCYDTNSTCKEYSGSCTYCADYLSN